MPTSHQDSSDSPPPSVTPSGEGAAPPRARAEAAPRLAWRTNAWLFVATVASAFVTYAVYEGPTRAGLFHAAQYTAALMAILLAHEFGHFIAARLHHVDATLPYFIPLPILSPFGTMGAVIRMRSLIPTRRALLDIGAAGPLAGLALAIPLYAWGVAHSQVQVLDGHKDYVQFGESLLLRLIERAWGPTVPDGSDVFLSPVAFAAWAGMFVTMINLLPAGQLDGGHVAYALFGPKQNRVAQWVHRSMLAFFFVSLASFIARDVRAGLGLWHFGRHVDNSIFWLIWFEVLAVLGSFSSPTRADGAAADRIGVRTRAVAALGLALMAGVGREQSSPLFWVAWFAGLGVLLVMEARLGALRPASTLLDHPPTGAQPLGVGRAIVAVLTLAFFVLLFMPTPIAM
jgi:membrane-associated protease RseP (regulator of RpoE activity)